MGKSLLKGLYFTPNKLLVYIAIAGMMFFIFLVVAPIVEYRPNCGSISRPKYLYGPLRHEYQIGLEILMKNYNIYHFKFGDKIYTPYIKIIGGTKEFDNSNFYINMEWRIVYSMAQGYLMSGQKIHPPDALIKAINSKRDKYGPFPRTDGIVGPVPGQFEDCDIMRAGAIRVELLDEQPVE